MSDSKSEKSTSGLPVATKEQSQRSVEEAVSSLPSLFVSVMEPIAVSIMQSVMSPITITTRRPSLRTRAALVSPVAAGGAIQSLFIPRRFAQPYVLHSVNDFGGAIRARRKELKLTQQDLSEKSGIGLRCISEIENGKATAEIGKVLELLAVLDLQLRVSERR